MQCFCVDSASFSVAAPSFEPDDSIVLEPAPILWYSSTSVFNGVAASAGASGTSAAIASAVAVYWAGLIDDCEPSSRVFALTAARPLQ